MPDNKPLSVAIASVVSNNKILLIKRVNEPYAGKWAFPGGKIELGEHVSDAAMRELLEETGIKSEFKEHLGSVSEHLIENGDIKEHFLLHICKLSPTSSEIVQGSEGEVGWFDLNNIEELQNLMVASDFSIMKKYVNEKQTGYTECVLEKQQNQYILKKFE